MDSHPADELADGNLGELVVAIDHIGIAVNDVDAAADFYRRVFGVAVRHHEVNEEQGVREAMIDIDPGGSRIQLIAPLTADSTVGRFLDRSGPGLHHLAYRVVDVDMAARQLRARGLRVLYPKAQRGTAGSRINFIDPRDTEGVLIEITEPAKPVIDRS
jgi:methylmalonyl-CoA/ethylmalonyl-CoA epimerase